MNKYYKHICAMLVMPLFAAIIAPLVILSLSDFNIMGFGSVEVYLGAILFFIGFSLSLSAVLTFAKEDESPMPWITKERLVVDGPFAFVRNPIMLGVILVIAGMAFFFNSIYVGIWNVILSVFMHIYLKRVEEPKLAKIFGYQYLAYYRDVPRWIPRRRAWKPEVL